jgi:hypothetical protein
MCFFFFIKQKTLFQKGNDLLARLLASIPLMRERYPPVYIAVHQKAELHHAVRTVNLTPKKKNIRTD